MLLLSFLNLLPDRVLEEPSEWVDQWTPVWIWALTRFLLGSRGSGLAQCMHAESESVLEVACVR